MVSRPGFSCYRAAAPIPWLGIGRPTDMKHCVLMIAALVALLFGAGCAGNRSAKLKPQDFSGPQTQSAPAAVSVSQGEPSPVKQSGPAAGGGSAASGVGVPAVPAVPGSASPAAGANAPAGTYMIVGAVVAEVNGQPIYADKVLAKIDAALAAAARRCEPREYRLVATDLIHRQIMEDITNELEFAAAQRNVSEEDQQIATAVTTQFRQREITKAGGSLAIARARALEEGVDFDEKLKEEYRRNMIRIYYVKRVFPKVQISADDMRRFYDKNVDELYSEKSAIRFRIIRVGFKETGSKEEAFKKAESIHAKAIRGDDFSALAAAQEDRTLARFRGYMDVRRDDKKEPIKDESGEYIGVFLPRGSLKLEELEKAIFALNPGQVSPIIDTPDALYIVKLEDKKTGRVRAFEEEFVQRDIHDRMTKEQRAELRKKEQKKLIDAAVTRTDEKMVQTAIEMAMQKYALWSRSAGAGN